MGRWFTRQELYDLVWSEPVSKVAPRYGISDVSFSKACARARVPLPPRGYWAKLRFGKPVVQVPLPKRGPGQSDRVHVGALTYGRSDEEDEELLKEIIPPEFPDDIRAIAAAIGPRVGRPRVPLLASQTHPVIERLLEEDTQRRAEKARRSYVYEWREPRFERPIDQRRLRIVNAIFLALERVDAEPDARTTMGLQFGAAVGDTWVPIEVGPMAKPKRGAPATASTKLQVQLPVEGIPGCESGIWDESESALDPRIGEIVTGVIVAAELLHRKREQEWYEFLVDLKGRREEERLQQQLEAERRERERRRAEEQARIDRLLREADQFRRAAEIRA